MRGSFWGAQKFVRVQRNSSAGQNVRFEGPFEGSRAAGGALLCYATRRIVSGVLSFKGVCASHEIVSRQIRAQPLCPDLYKRDASGTPCWSTRFRRRMTRHVLLLLAPSPSRIQHTCHLAGASITRPPRFARRWRVGLVTRGGGGGRVSSCGRGSSCDNYPVPR